MVTRAKIEIALNDISLATGQYIILCAKTQVSDTGSRALLFQILGKMSQNFSSAAVVNFFFSFSD